MSSLIGSMGAAAEAVISNGMKCVRGGYLYIGENITVNGTGLCMLNTGSSTTGNSSSYCTAILTIDGVSNISADNFIVATSAYGFVNNQGYTSSAYRASCVIPFKNSITIQSTGSTSLNYAVYTV